METTIRDIERQKTDSDLPFHQGEKSRSGWQLLLCWLLYCFLECLRTWDIIARSYLPAKCWRLLVCKIFPDDDLLFPHCLYLLSWFNFLTVMYAFHWRGFFYLKILWAQLIPGQISWFIWVTNEIILHPNDSICNVHNLTQINTCIKDICELPCVIPFPSSWRAEVFDTFLSEKARSYNFWLLDCSFTKFLSNNQTAAQIQQIRLL